MRQESDSPPPPQIFPFPIKLFEVYHYLCVRLRGFFMGERNDDRKYRSAFVGYRGQTTPPEIGHALLFANTSFVGSFKSHRVMNICLRFIGLIRED